VKRVDVNEEAISGVNIVPVIDVTLVLLVILLLMGPLVNLPNLHVDLPEAMTKETKDQNLTISLSSEGEISIDTDIVSWDAFPQKFRNALRGREDAFVIVRADKNLPYGNVENFLRTVNKYAGNHAVAIATQQRSVKLEPSQP